MDPTEKYFGIWTPYSICNIRVISMRMEERTSENAKILENLGDTAMEAIKRTLRGSLKL